MLRFHYDPSRKGNEVYASIHNIDMETGQVGDSIGVLNNTGGKNLRANPILNRLYNILDDHVVIGDVEDGHEYYRTKGGSTLRVQNAGQGAGAMTVEGSYQVNGESEPLAVDFVYDQTNGGNGKTYILEQGEVLGTRQTVFDILSQHEEFSRFRELLEGSNLLESVHDGKYACHAENCISTFNNYHYTVYVPTNESIDRLIADGTLPTWEDVAQLDPDDPEQQAEAERLSQKINDFLRYHIQDNSFFIGANNIVAKDDQSKDIVEAQYETAFIDKKEKKFNRLTVTLTPSGDAITVKDAVGNVRHVVTSDPSLYNQMAREYTYTTDSKSSSGNNIFASSSAVVHQIDGPLLVDAWLTK
jgi:hypothetical protein